MKLDDLLALMRRVPKGAGPAEIAEAKALLLAAVSEDVDAVNMFIKSAEYSEWVRQSRDAINEYNERKGK